MYCYVVCIKNGLERQRSGFMSVCLKFSCYLRDKSTPRTNGKIHILLKEWDDTNKQDSNNYLSSSSSSHQSKNPVEYTSNNEYQMLIMVKK